MSLPFEENGLDRAFDRPLWTLDKVATQKKSLRGKWPHLKTIKATLSKFAKLLAVKLVHSMIIPALLISNLMTQMYLNDPRSMPSSRSWRTSHS